MQQAIEKLYKIHHGMTVHWLNPEELKKYQYTWIGEDEVPLYVELPCYLLEEDLSKLEEFRLKPTYPQYLQPANNPTTPQNLRWISPTTFEWLRQGTNHLLMGDVEKAMPFCNVDQECDAEIINNLGVVHLLHGDLTNAITKFASALLHDFTMYKNPLYPQNLAKAHFLRGTTHDLNMAIYYCNQVIGGGAHFIFPYGLLVMIYQKQNNLPAAREACQKILSLSGKVSDRLYAFLQLHQLCDIPTHLGFYKENIKQLILAKITTEKNMLTNDLLLLARGHHCLGNKVQAAECLKIIVTQFLPFSINVIYRDDFFNLATNSEYWPIKEERTITNMAQAKHQMLLMLSNISEPTLKQNALWQSLISGDSQTFLGSFFYSNNGLFSKKSSILNANDPLSSILKMLRTEISNRGIRIYPATQKALNTDSELIKILQSHFGDFYRELVTNKIIFSPRVDNQTEKSTFGVLTSILVSPDAVSNIQDKKEIPEPFVLKTSTSNLESPPVSSLKVVESKNYEILPPREVRPQDRKSFNDHCRMYVSKKSPNEETLLLNISSELSIQHLRDGEIDLAEPHIKKGLAIEGLRYCQKAALLNSMGTVHLLRSNLKDAIACYDEAFYLDPESIYADSLATAFFLKDSLIGAGSYCHLAIEQNPKWDLPHVLLGVICFNQGELSAARDAYLKSLTLEPCASTQIYVNVQLLKLGPDTNAKDYNKKLQLLMTQIDSQQSMDASDLLALAMGNYYFGRPKAAGQCLQLLLSKHLPHSILPLYYSEFFTILTDARCERIAFESTEKMQQAKKQMLDMLRLIKEPKLQKRAAEFCENGLVTREENSLVNDEHISSVSASQLRI